MPRKLPWIVAALLIAAFSAGFLSGNRFGNRDSRIRPAFHDLRVNHVTDYQALVKARDPAVRALAKRLATPEAAYLHVRDRIRYDPMASAASPGEILRDGAASCLGKATLLCSLYRAMGIPAGKVRVVTGNVAFQEALADHAWLDLEYKGACLQQDPSGFLGSFGFAEFPGTEFTNTFVQEEDFCFNDRHFAVISQLNRFRNGFPGGMGAAP